LIYSDVLRKATLKQETVLDLPFRNLVRLASFKALVLREALPHEPTNYQPGDNITNCYKA
jgi:hypothetical protein